MAWMTLKKTDGKLIEVDTGKLGLIELKTEHTMNEADSVIGGTIHIDGVTITIDEVSVRRLVREVRFGI